MIRKSMLAAALCAALGGCVTTGAGTTTGPTAGGVNINAVISQVQGITSTACAFLPTAATIASLFKSGGYGDAFAVASAICQAVSGVQPVTGRRALSRVPTVHGVAIRGKFVGARRG